MKEASARAVAAKVLARVWEDRAFASAALDAELARRAPMDPREAALATELTYGVLRTEAFLEEEIAKLSAKKSKLGAEARAHLSIGFYSLAFLDRVPSFAAVSEAVEGVRAADSEHAARFANAVLRRYAEACAIARPSFDEATSRSAPGWLRGALRRSIGRAEAASFLAVSEPPSVAIAVAHSAARDAWLEKLRAAAPHATFEPGKVSPHAILARGAGDLRKLPGCSTDWIVQEEGAQTIALALGARPGDVVLDACAGHGNKSFLIGASVGEDGALDAADLYASKLDELRAGPAATLVRATFAVDWSKGIGDAKGPYDRVLVDAPCSGIGTLRRRPEIARHRTADDIPRLAELQAAILERTATLLAPSGRLVYAVCSVLREESEGVLERVADLLEPAPFDAKIGDDLARGGASFRLLPSTHGTDGYFVASLVRRAKR